MQWDDKIKAYILDKLLERGELVQTFVLSDKRDFRILRVVYLWFALSVPYFILCLIGKILVWWVMLLRPWINSKEDLLFVLFLGATTLIVGSAYLLLKFMNALNGIMEKFWGGHR